MYYLIYISTAVKLMTDAELAEILTTSRKNNEQKDVTGMLLYCEGTFIQLLEGDKKEVEDIYQIIERDSRHKNLIKLMTGESEKRNLPDWSMGFASTNKTVLNQLQGYTDPAHPEFLNISDKHSSTAITILKTFAENNKIAG